LKNSIYLATFGAILMTICI